MIGTIFSLYMFIDYCINPTPKRLGVPKFHEQVAMVVYERHTVD